LKLRQKFEYDYPLDLVVRITHYDLLENPDLLKEVMNIREVRMTHFKEYADGRQEAEHSFSAYDEIPGFARAVIRPHMLAWKQVSKWNPRDMTYSFEIVPAFMKKSFSCRGAWKYSDDNGKTTRKLEGNLDVKIPVIGPMAEMFISRRVYEGHRDMNKKFLARMKEASRDKKE